MYVWFPSSSSVLSFRAIMFCVSVCFYLFTKKTHVLFFYPLCMCAVSVVYFSRNPMRAIICMLLFCIEWRHC
jgi:hypothetical protein